MTTDDSTSLTTDSTRQSVTRRHLLAVGGGVGLTLLAGCSGQSADGPDGSSGDTSTDGSTESSTDASGDSGSGDVTAGTTGTFRLLVSDQPVAIDDFDSLEVSFEKARVFKSQREDTAEADASASTGTDAETATTADTTATATPTSTPTPTPTETATGTVTESTTDPEDDSAAAASDADDETDEERRGFTVIDLEGATVDLTRLVGERASSVFTGELETGRYTKIELYAATVDGIVDGESVEVKIPSGKLMLTKPFTVEAGETLSFVFDINVVRKGNNGYNLLPVISESGVAGEDVAVEEVDREDATGTATSPSNSTSTSSGGGSQGNGKGKERS